MTTRFERIALVGLPGAGKSTVARLLADRLGWACADTDSEVAAVAGRDPAWVIEHDGEAAFRRLELEALRRIVAGPTPVVIACGGGLVAQPDSARLLTGVADVVWLDAPDAVLLHRLGDGLGRPLLAPDPVQRLAALRAERSRAYGVAHLCVAADAPAADVAGRIAAVVGSSVSVDAASASYRVEVRSGAVDDVSLHLPPGAARVAVVADQAVRRPCRRIMSQLKREGRAVSLIAMRGGERVKTWQSAGRLLARLGDAGVRRSDCVVAVGGGSVGDLAGFAAATHLRGVAWINVPSTLLAMVDSAIGGKTGVNLARGKNLAGAIWQPRAVICDPDLLAGLPVRQYRAALAEVVKYSMVFGDGLVDVLDRHLEALLARDPERLTDVIRRSIEAKARTVAEDERESGPRALLNYGHTVGHALETATDYSAVLNHGEAVAVGMRVAGALSVAQLGCPGDDIAWQDSVLERCGLGRAPSVPVRRVMAAISSDKKQTAGGTGWVLLESRGSACYGQLVPEHLVEAELRRVLPG